jgi:hypothetical protein
MYVDEVGNHDLKSADNPNERFLSLSGVIIESTHYRDVISIEIENLKRKHFRYDPDAPLIFHRHDIINKTNGFEALASQQICEEFDEDLIRALQDWHYTVITALIDKQEHKSKYSVMQAHPYHYCLEVLLERYSMYLNGLNSKGDVLAESRGKREDLLLKDTYRKFFIEGTEFKRLAMAISSCELKVKPKDQNIAGLQLADLLAHPARRYILREYGLLEDYRDVFGDRIVNILCDQKFRRSPNGTIIGYGIKKLP